MWLQRDGVKGERGSKRRRGVRTRRRNKTSPSSWSFVEDSQRQRQTQEETCFPPHSSVRELFLQKSKADPAVEGDPSEEEGDGKDVVVSPARSEVREGQEESWEFLYDEKEMKSVWDRE